MPKDAAKGKPGTEMRSHFVRASKIEVDNTTPCSAPAGIFWIHAHPPKLPNELGIWTGKWLIRIPCEYVDYCWGTVREATTAGKLGIGAKVSTDWGTANDAVQGFRGHTICIYTQDFRDAEDVLRVARGLKQADSIRKGPIHYKPDIETFAGRYAGNSPGGIAVYTYKPLRDELIVNEENLAAATNLCSVPEIIARRQESLAAMLGS